MATPIHSVHTLIDKIQSLPIDRIAEVEDFVDFLKQRAKLRKMVTHKQSLDFPVMSVGKWPDNLSLGRKDMYGDDGR